MKQKTWADLLGKDTSRCQVDGCDIVRRLKHDTIQFVWSFDTPQQAEQAFTAWKKELETVKPVILALSNFCIVGCLDPRQYNGAEAPWPHGWKELLDQGVKFDQLDTELPPEMAQAYLEHYKPQGDTHCPNCGCNEFYATQSVRGSVPVVVALSNSKHPIFLRNATDDGEMDTSGLDCDDPEGPFGCVKCGHTLETP